MDYKQIELTLSFGREREEVTLTASEAEGTGLAYNPAGGNEEYGWVVTHLASKHIVIHGLDTEHEAKQLLEKIAPLTDWHQPIETLANRPDLAAKVRDARTDIIHRLNMQIESACKQCMPNYLAEDVMNDLDESETIRRALLYAFKIVS